MSSSTTLESLKDEFTSYGTVLHAKIEQKSDDEFFGFVKYENPDHHFGAITHLNGKVVDGKAWTVSHVYKMENKLERHDRIKEAMDEERVLYVSNLCCQVKDSDLENVFGGFGDVIACHIRRHHDGRSKGDAFIEYATKESVVKAMSAMEGKSIWGRRIYLGLGKIN
ncbi:unnamed protein product [Arabis nemorensis]|uniref:RRM domain-containing protein n=1 Tax=Arabis nemorensis TaxID=586526 RepID=A0A565CGZ9_9BRAS|nr:unnamed protein product [Arabis nemorensis]